jgi:hypothetical protein
MADTADKAATAGAGDDFRHGPQIPYNVRIIDNPTQQELRELSRYHVPHAYRSNVGNLNRITRCKSRMAQSTYIIADPSEQGLFSAKVMLRERAERLIRMQREYIERGGILIKIDGYQGHGPLAPPVQWLYTPEAANIATGRRRPTSSPGPFNHDSA